MSIKERTKIAASEMYQNLFPIDAQVAPLDRQTFEAVLALNLEMWWHTGRRDIAAEFAMVDAVPSAQSYRH